jgi:hypothetical protein
MDFLRENSRKSAPQQPYALDLAPFDFDLFADAKGCLTGRSFADLRELLDGVGVMLDGRKQEQSRRFSSTEWSG